LSASTGSRRRCLPVIEFHRIGEFANLGEQLTLLTTVLNRATEFHAALIFLLTAGFDCAVAFFVGLGHFESPKTSTGVTR
jgi:hypothetical protein